MSDFRKLVLDIGTNSILALLTVVKNGRLRIISDRKITTKLGEGLIETGAISPQAIDRGLNAVVELVESSNFDSVLILATEALRKATNSQEFVELVKNKTGYDIQIISGDKEAELSYLGGIYELDTADSMTLLVDVGGGSTELVLGQSGNVLYSVSVPIGALKLRDAVNNDNLSDYADHAEKILKPLIDLSMLSKAETFVATGGTITSVAAMIEGLIQYEASKFHNMSLKREDLLNTANRFEEASKTKRESMIPFDKKRADLIFRGWEYFQVL